MQETNRFTPTEGHACSACKIGLRVNMREITTNTPIVQLTTQIRPKYVHQVAVRLKMFILLQPQIELIKFLARKTYDHSTDLTGGKHAASLNHKACRALNTVHTCTTCMTCTKPQTQV